MNRIREARKAKMMTMKELGKLVGVAESTISMYETGKREPDNTTLKRLADILETTTDYLLDRVQESDDENAKKAAANPANSLSQEVSSLFEQLTPDAQKQVLSYAHFLLSSEYTSQLPESDPHSSEKSDA